MEFRKENDALLLLYTPEFNADDVRKKLDEDNLHLKHTFHLGHAHQYNSESIEDPDEEFCFKIGKLENGFYMLDREVFGTDHNFFFSANIKFTPSLFIAHQNRPILPKIDRLISSDVYISDQEDAIPNRIPFSEYEALVKTFPNSTEIQRYTDARIYQALSNYLDGLGDLTAKYEQYLNKRTSNLPIAPETPNSISQVLFRNTYETFRDMLNHSDSYSERDWQIAVCQIVRILYPKYILAKREQCIGSDGYKKKIPDFLLIDASGFVDVLEIKKPNHQKLLTSTQYRNNYVADRDLSGAIVQIEKYIYTLNHGGASLESSLQRSLSSELPENFNIRITNPQGMLLMGRSNNLSEEQQLDLEIIKRQHKNIVDIMTYDDLLSRLKNIATQLDS